MNFETIVLSVCGLALGYLGYLLAGAADEIGIRIAEDIDSRTGINTATVRMIDGEVFVDPIVR